MTSIPTATTSAAPVPATAAASEANGNPSASQLERLADVVARNPERALERLVALIGSSPFGREDVAEGARHARVVELS